MDEATKKSVRNGLYAGLIFAVISFFYGGIYTEIIIEGLKFNFKNLSLAFAGSLIVGLTFFIPVFFISLIYYYFTEK